MTNEEKLIAIKNLRLAIDLAGDGGPAAFYSDEEDMMRDLLDECEYIPNPDWESISNSN